MLFLSILQENEQDRRQAQACNIVPFNKKFFILSKHRQVDPLSPAVGAPSRSAPVESNVLLQEKQLNLQDDREKNIYKKLKDRGFVLTPAFDPALP